VGKKLFEKVFSPHPFFKNIYVGKKLFEKVFSPHPFFKNFYTGHRDKVFEKGLGSYLRNKLGRNFFQKVSPR
jgi:hypothetical protein